MDPLRDDINKLKFYFNENSKLTILKGESTRQLQSIANDFRAPFNIGLPDEAGNYDISHPGYIFMINPEGQLSLVYSGRFVDTDKILEDLFLYRSHLS